MRDTLNQIAALQTLNKEIQQQERDRDALHIDVQQQHKRIDELRKRIDEGAARRVQHQKASDALDLKVRETEETNAKYNIQLNVTKHQGEYDTIRRSIASHQADIAKWEDEELQLLQKVDELRSEETALVKELEAAQKELGEIERRVAEQAAEYDRHILEVERQRDTQQQQIEPRVLEAYRRVANGLCETGLAEVKRRICQGCFTMITKQTENELLRDSAIVYCQSCGRILMLAEGEEVLSGDVED
jgi:hypothetical protein